jgi:hypothetical protein
MNARLLVVLFFSLALAAPSNKGDSESTTDVRSAAQRRRLLALAIDSDFELAGNHGPHTDAVGGNSI